MKQPKLRLKKDGTPRADDLARYKAHIKQNFAAYREFFGENLPKPLQGYFRQIEGAKRAAENRIHNPETGQFFSKKQQKIVQEELEDYAKLKGIDPKEVLAKKDLYNLVYDLVKNRRTIDTVPSDIAIDMIHLPRVKTVFVLDQTGKKTQVSKAKAIKMIVDANKAAMKATGGYNTALRTRDNFLTGELTVFAPDFSGMSDEAIADEIESQTEAGEYSISMSDPKARKAKKRRKNAGKKAINKKPNGQRGHTKRN